MAAPEIAVVVPSHDRPLRLRWLLNAMEEQTLPRDRWEMIVGHDSSGSETDEILTSHPLAKAGVLRYVKLEPGTAPPGRNRNAAWRLTRAPVIAFTDDDCRPPVDWLENALRAAQRHPGAIVQGSTMPDPDEGKTGIHAPYVKTQTIWPVPPRPWAQACNIIYPRDVLERAGGFPEDMYVGEDTALAENARALGVEYFGAPEVVTRHAIDETTLWGMVKGAFRWDGLPLLLKRHPRMREEFPAGIFWKRTHVWAPFAALGLWGVKRTRFSLALTLPWLVHATPKHHGTHPRGRIRSALELPGKFAIDVAEILALVKGSIKHRTFFL